LEIGFQILITFDFVEFDLHRVRRTQTDTLLGFAFSRASPPDARDLLGKVSPIESALCLPESTA
jgi:hypothetical protein